MPFRRTLLLAARVLPHPFSITPARRRPQASSRGSTFRHRPDLHSRATASRLRRDPADRAARRPAEAELRRLPVRLPDIDVLNTLDGFNLQPRLSIPFTGAIDPASATSANVFLVRLPDGAVTGINQVVWDPRRGRSTRSPTSCSTSTRATCSSSRTACATPPATRSRPARFLRDLNYGQTKDRADKAYRKELHRGARASRCPPASASDVAAASLFTTQSATTLLEQVRARSRRRRRLRRASRSARPASGRCSRDRASARSCSRARTRGAAARPRTSAADLRRCSASSGSSARSPSAPTRRRTTRPPAKRSRRSARPPASRPCGARTASTSSCSSRRPAPAGGWPVAIFGHGFGDNKNSSPLVVAASMAQAGIATIAINVVGHGGGALGTLTVNRTAGAPVTLPAGGRGIDQDGNGTIDSTEGVNAVAPQTLVGSRDGLRQTVIDLMQLVRELEAGMDVDGDGARRPGRRLGSPISASRSAASTGRSSSRWSRTSTPASRTFPAARSSRSRA